MDWGGRSFGLIVGTRSYICVQRSHLIQVNTLLPDICASFFFHFGKASGISHNDPHAGNVGRRAADPGTLEAFDFERSTVTTTAHPNADEAEMSAYARAVRDGNRDLAERLFQQARQRSGLDGLMGRFRRMWVTPVIGYAAAFNLEMLRAQEQ
jgi:hypothetical protein